MQEFKFFHLGFIQKISERVLFNSKSSYSHYTLIPYPLLGLFQQISTLFFVVSRALVCNTLTQIGHFRAKWTQNFEISYSKSSQQLQKRFKYLCFAFERFSVKNFKDFFVQRQTHFDKVSHQRRCQKPPEGGGGPKTAKP